MFLPSRASGSNLEDLVRWGLPEPLDMSVRPSHFEVYSPLQHRHLFLLVTPPRFRLRNCSYPQSTSSRKSPGDFVSGLRTANPNRRPGAPSPQAVPSSPAHTFCFFADTYHLRLLSSSATGPENTPVSLSHRALRYSTAIS
jgi:hypothetical protein